MPFQATVYRVLIASPSDLTNERRAMREAIEVWNSRYAADQSAVLLPVMWETDATPQTGGRPQEFINEELVRPSDILIGAFWTRIGTPSGKEESGTIEEIKELLSAEKPVMLYFSDRPIPPSRIDHRQHEKLKEFKAWARENSIYATFTSTNKLKDQLANHLLSTIRRLQGSAITEVVQPVIDTSATEQTIMRLAQAEGIREMAGDSPLVEHFMRQDAERKACISLARIGGFNTNSDRITVPFLLRNESRTPAYDITVDVDFDGRTIMSGAKAETIKGDGGTREFSFRLPREHYRDDTFEYSSTFTIHVGFRDGVGTDTATFFCTFRGKDPNFQIAEDRTKAEVSRLCRYVRPK